MATLLVDGLSHTGEVTQLLVRGEPSGPSPGDPLLWVFGDLAAAPPGDLLMPSNAQNDLKRRVMRARFPVMDVFFAGNALRLVANAIPWHGMPGASMSSPLNLVEIVERLSRLSGGALLDLRFEGHGSTAKGGWTPVAEGADRERWHAFDSYAAGLAARFAAGALESARPGELLVIGVPSVALGATGSAREITGTPEAASPELVQLASTRVARPWLPAEPWPVLPWLFFGLTGLLALSATRDHRLGTALLTIGGLAALGSGLRAVAAVQRILAVPQAKVRSMAMGPVELSGQVRAVAPFPSPHSALACAWLRWVIEQRTTDNRGRERWQTVAHGEITQVPFHLDDATGQVLVQLAAAQVEVDPLVTALGPDRRAREWMLLEGATVFVYGLAQRQSHVEERRVALQESLRASKHDAALRASLGLPAEGELTMEQWDRLHESVQATFDAKNAALDSRPDEVFVGASADVPLVISPLSRDRELGRLRVRLWAGVLGGGTLLLVALLAALRLVR